MTWHLPARGTIYYPPGAAVPLPAGTPAPQGSKAHRIGEHQRDILVRCRRSPSQGTLIRRDNRLIQAAELQAAHALEADGLIQMREFGGTCLGWLWVVVLTDRGRDDWLGLIRNPRIRPDTLQSG